MEKAKLVLKKRYCYHHTKFEPILNFEFKNGKYLTFCKDAYNYQKDYRKNYCRGSNIDTIIKSKIKCCVTFDKLTFNTKPDDYITLEYIKSMVENEKICKYCGISMNFINFERYDQHQFTINRLNNDLGHIRSNVEICCLNCNSKLGGSVGFHRKKQCKFLNLENDEIYEYESQISASNDLNIHVSNISYLINNKVRKSWSSTKHSYISVFEENNITQLNP